VITVASGADTVDGSKHSVSKNPSTGLYYRLHILNVGVSDVKKHRCKATNFQDFYIKLDVLGRYNYSLVILKMGEKTIFLQIILKFCSRLV
jgi:hypothetical protein